MPVSRTLPLLSLVLLMTACASAPDDFDRSRRGPPAEAHNGGSAGVVDDLQTQLAEVEQRLSLTPLQQPLWERYRETIGALMADQLRLDPRPVTRIDAVKQIGRKVDVVRNRLVAMEDIAEAAELLYGTLDADQRRVADRLLPGTVPALYSGLPGRGAEDGSARDRRGERGGPPPGGRRERAQ
ncbi:Spy/CpxP family protein refolding chaperone [Methyloversatilis discipulorum]|jgi:hypothetical protein|uniref:Spy/CpxP family protein refolding chaperone n=1 Tax=Methyloversatilis discipulorum TaxID=1119528 RepID=UPI003137A5F7